jgi:hypothetical protein
MALTAWNRSVRVPRSAAGRRPRTAEAALPPSRRPIGIRLRACVKNKMWGYSVRPDRESERVEQHDAKLTLTIAPTMPIMTRGWAGIGVARVCSMTDGRSTLDSSPTSKELWNRPAGNTGKDASTSVGASPVRTRPTAKAATEQRAPTSGPAALTSKS